MIDKVGSSLSIAHVMVSDNFAGVERYVSQTATELASRGHKVHIVGGSPVGVRNNISEAVGWYDGSSMRLAMRALNKLNVDIVHAHMTKSEAVGLLRARRGGTSLIATRHFAHFRGSTPPAKIFSRVFNRLVDHQIAISDFVASEVEKTPDSTIKLGTPPSEERYASDSRVVLIVQRLELEKQTSVGVDAWAESGLAALGWKLRILGVGNEADRLTRLVADKGLNGSVEFVGWSADVAGHLSRAALLLATAPREPFGLGIVEAMAAGVPVLAAAGGGHLETIGLVPSAQLFPPGDAFAAGCLLRRIATDADLRLIMSGDVRTHQATQLTVTGHVDHLLSVYHAVLRRQRSSDSR